MLMSLSLHRCSINMRDVNCWVVRNGSSQQFVKDEEFPNQSMHGAAWPTRTYLFYTSYVLLSILCFFFRHAVTLNVYLQKSTDSKRSRRLADSYRRVTLFRFQCVYQPHTGVWGPNEADACGSEQCSSDIVMNIQRVTTVSAHYIANTADAFNKAISTSSFLGYYSPLCMTFWSRWSDVDGCLQQAGPPAQLPPAEKWLMFYLKERKVVWQCSRYEGWHRHTTCVGGWAASRF